MNVHAPELHRDLARNELPLAGIGDKFLAQPGARVEAAEHIAAGHVMKAGNGAQHFALRALATAGRAEHQDGAEFSKLSRLTHGHFSVIGSGTRYKRAPQKT